MRAMYKTLSAAVAALAVVALATTGPIDAANTSSAPAPGTTPPPQIYHIVTRPLCAELHKHIAPAVGMILQNDATIKKSPKLFSDYNRDALDGVDNTVSNSAPNPQGASLLNSSGTMNAAQNMTALQMENLVTPLANNIIAIKNLLNSPALTHGTGDPQDDARLQDIRDKLLKAVADQSASLDLINGFVQTEQMGDLQHVGEEYVSAINQSDTTKGNPSTGATPNPLLQNPNQPGLAPDPYNVNLAAIPGLTLGYNPVTRILSAVKWTIKQTAHNENVASKAILSSAALCGSGPAPAATSQP